ncbi:MAG TPA: tryptophan transporter [Firmicutes bacterium]|nr:tryptophan transporter [Bacillota bacterium]
MKTKELALTALFLAIGLVLHQITIGLLGGMKPDFVVTMLLVSFLMLRNKRLVIPAGLAAGVIAALTTTMPGGQLPNIIDKLITAFVSMGLILLLQGHVSNNVLAATVGFIGTLVSGTAFLGSAQLIIGLPVSFKALFITVVLPTAAINTLLTPTIYGIAMGPARSAGLVSKSQSAAGAKATAGKLSDS